MNYPEVIESHKFRVFDILASKWRRYSFWSKASDVELEDGTNVEDAIDEINSSLSPNYFYDSYEDALDDIANIREGGMVDTADSEPTIQDVIDGMTALHLAGSQVGTGIKNFTFNTEAYKRMLIITKKSGVIVGSKEVPTDVLNTNDVIPLGNVASIIGTEYALEAQTDNNLLQKEIALYNNNGTPLIVDNDDVNTRLASAKGIGLASDLSQTTGASLTYNGNNSFTITVTDSSLSVYVYVDMLVLGGSASGRNVSFNGAGTDLVSTDVEGAIKEVYEMSNRELDFANKQVLTPATSGILNATIAGDKVGALYIGINATSTATTRILVDGEPVAVVNGSQETPESRIVYGVKGGQAVTSIESLHGNDNRNTVIFYPYK